MSRWIMYTSVLIWVLFANLAMAQGKPEKGARLFERMDLNGDGMIDQQEFETHRNASPPPGMKKRNPSINFSDLDANDDEKISFDEWRSGRMNKRALGAKSKKMPVFEDFDRNQDGKITKEEFEKTRADRITKRADKGYPMRNVGNAPSFDDMDINGDGVIQLDEFTQHKMERRKTKQKM